MPKSYTLADFHHLIRNSLKITARDALFFFIFNKNILPLNNQTIEELYHIYHENGVLRLHYEQEETFG